MSRASSLARINASVAGALGYMPVNKAGDTMTGDLALSGGMLKRTMTGDGAAIQIKGSYGGNPSIFEVVQSASDGYAYIRDALGNAAQITGYPNGMSMLRGKVRMPEQTVFCVTGTNYAQENGWSIVVPANEYIDRGGCYNPSNGRFTAPVAGAYVFNANGLIYPSNTTVITAGWAKNGGFLTYCNTQGGEADTNHMNYTNSVVMDLSAGDYVDFWIFSNGAAKAYSSQWIMYGYLIG